MRASTLSLILAISALPAFPAPKAPHWVATWTTAQPLIRPPANPKTVPQGFKNQTVRMLVRTSIAGPKLRIRISSPFGANVVTLGAAHVALPAAGSAIQPASDKALTFNGQPGCTLGPGMVILSDPIDFPVPAQSDLAVSLYFPGESGPPSSHNGQRFSYVASTEGDLTAAAEIPNPTKALAYYYLAGVDVLAPPKSAAIVTLGDSITEGARSTPDTNRMWPAVLSARLAANKKTAHLAVANVGIGGNRVLRDVAGASVLARLDRDVLSQPGVQWVIFLEGINDIGHLDRDPVTAEALIGAYKQIIERAHSRGIRIAGATLVAYLGAAYSRPEGETIRLAVNQWIRTSGAFDAVIDFEAATRDPKNPNRLRADFDPGDHLHPNDAGYKAMADAIDLRIFTR